MVYGVSLGPGHPDLITVRGLQILQQVDKIYYPGSLFSDGGQSSYAHSILSHYALEESKLHGFFLRMNDQRAQAELIYEQTVNAILLDLKHQRSVAIVSEGDLSTYSSFSYILRRLKQHQLLIELVPGITSFALAAAEVQMPLCQLNEKVIILPRVQSEDQLVEALHQCDTLILMKIKSVVPIVLNVVADKKLTVHYYEKLGTPQQFITDDLRLLHKRDIPYFSLITIKKCVSQ